MGISFLIRGGLIIDGSESNSEPRRADIALEGDRIRAIGDLSGVEAERTIDASGCYVCPGFIDTHSHSEFSLLADGRAEGKICQGITTEINGNCGLSAAPLYGQALEQRKSELREFGIKERWNNLAEYLSILDKRRFAINFATLVGHNNLRASIIGYTDSTLSRAQMEKVKELLREALRSGAVGFSTGLAYPPGIYSETGEIIELARETASHGGIYTTHLRSEGDNLLEAVDEVMEIATSSGIQAHISHLKTSGERNWRKLGGVFERINIAHKRGLDITCDRYPYIASSTDLDAILPAWTYRGGRKEELRRIKEETERIMREILDTHPDESYWERVCIASMNSERNRWMEGKSLSEISKIRGISPVRCLLDILVEEELNVGAIFFSMDEGNLISILKQPYAMIGSDSAARSFDGITVRGRPHPRGFGSFPRVLGRFVRELGIISLSEAIHKMTGLPAKTFRLRQRGLIAEGYFADIVIFDHEVIKDRADFDDPFRRPEGIYHVFVNGVPVMVDGELTGAMPGRILRHRD